MRGQAPSRLAAAHRGVILTGGPSLITGYNNHEDITVPFAAVNFETEEYLPVPDSPYYERYGLLTLPKVGACRFRLVIKARVHDGTEEDMLSNYEKQAIGEILQSLVTEGEPADDLTTLEIPVASPTVEQWTNIGSAALDELTPEKIQQAMREAVEQTLGYNPTASRYPQWLYYREGADGTPQYRTTCAGQGEDGCKSFDLYLSFHSKPMQKVIDSVRGLCEHLIALGMQGQALNDVATAMNELLDSVPCVEGDKEPEQAKPTHKSKGTH